MLLLSEYFKADAYLHGFLFFLSHHESMFWKQYPAESQKPVAGYAEASDKILLY